MQRIQIDRVQLADMWLAGVSTADMAKHFGCSQSVIHRQLKAASLHRPVGPQKAWKDQFSDQDIVGLYAELRSTPLVAERVGCTSKTVWNILVKHGVDIRGKSGPDHSQWKGGRITDSGGYILVRNPEHPASVGGYVPEHRLVMESHIGRYLLPDEEVHHRNLDKSDNRFENLKLYSSASDHMKQEHASPDRIAHMMKIRKDRTESILAAAGPILRHLVNGYRLSPNEISQLTGLPNSFVGSWCRRAECRRLQGKRPERQITPAIRELASQLQPILSPLARGAKTCKQ
jgi:hypothetical protein